MEQQRRKTRQELRSEETKSSIRDAAGRLFTARGYDAVTMREIAKEAGCSHTTIYLYFKDKEALLEQLALPPLMVLEETMQAVMNRPELSSTEALKEVSRQFLRFCLSHKSMVTIILNVKSVRVDEANPDADINRRRNRIFGCFTQILNRVIRPASDEEKINYTRIYYYMLHGMVTTYTENEEPLEQLLARILPLLDQAIDILLLGMQAKLEQRG
ncbi:TetR/AcrR family transcriptional regulator [Paenibacillus doosanensis]|uniref:HTH-type transcriptional regulator AcrR n=1 Tax=Paenibacillus konkukensis TaxID=2020716 RepID=A0ABY4RMW8_9BACL|nr:MULTISPECIES: TetR/AcrR family transcriptional regulator [Paenibacillus]MCS7464941.1 TetR/AcrR family transcriptional regulator [Paenibacillus doosanensis]UQZ83766.1 HTH-type transcriptional regulator AcrR [Paenibacillus konkukensis]